MNNYRYRTCCECGLAWNVSVKAENIKKYICPVCRNKERKEHKKKSAAPKSDTLFFRFFCCLPTLRPIRAALLPVIIINSLY